MRGGDLPGLGLQKISGRILEAEGAGGYHPPDLVYDTMSNRKRKSWNLAAALDSPGYIY